MILLQKRMRRMRERRKTEAGLVGKENLPLSTPLMVSSHPVPMQQSLLTSDTINLNPGCGDDDKWSGFKDEKPNSTSRSSKKHKRTDDITRSSNNKRTGDISSSSKKSTVTWNVGGKTTGSLMSDYVLSKKDDLAVEFIRNSIEDKTLVDVHGEWVKQYQMRCLMDPTAWLDKVVINAYISYIRSQKHLDYCQDGKVFLEVTFMSTMFKEAGKKMLNPAAEDDEIPVDNTLHDVIIQQSKKYLEHDMIFLPINIEDQHWYLAIVNSRKTTIKVLDSLCWTNRRLELHHTLKGLSKCFHSNQANGESVHGWESLDVHEWEVDEIFSAPLQTDCFSCGLFELKFSELWTAISITQNEIKAFRLKLAACLLLWKANVADLEDNNTQKDTGTPHDPSDCFIVENEHQDLKTPQSAILATVIPEYPISIDKRKKVLGDHFASHPSRVHQSQTANKSQSQHIVILFIIINHNFKV